MSERIRRWCTIHHFFHRDCADCLDKDYADLERQLAEAVEKLDAMREASAHVPHIFRGHDKGERMCQRCVFDHILKEE